MLFLNGPSALAFEVGAGSEKMRLTSTGLGIGTQSPNTTLTLSDETDEFDFGVTANLLMIKSVTADGSDDHRIIIDAGNGGTTSTRGAYLALSGNEAASEAGKAIYQMGNVTGSAHVFRKAGGVDAVTIDSSGNVSIGTVVPSVWHGQETALQIGSTALSDYSVGGANVSAIYNNAYRAANNNAVYKETDFASNYSQYNGRHTFNVAASGTAGDDISWIQAMRIDASGNVGIGTDAVTSPGLWYDTNPGYLAISHWATPPTPAAMLHLSDNSNDLDVPQIRIEGRENPGDTVLDIAVRDAAVRLNLVEGSVDAAAGFGQMIFKTNAAANTSYPARGGFLFSTPAISSNLVIANTGKVGIGTSSPNSPLEVSSNAAQLRLSTATQPTNYYTEIMSPYDSANPFRMQGHYNGTTVKFIEMTAAGGFSGPILKVGQGMSYTSLYTGTTERISIQPTQGSTYENIHETITGNLNLSLLRGMRFARAGSIANEVKSRLFLGSYTYSGGTIDYVITDGGGNQNHVGSGTINWYAREAVVHYTLTGTNVSSKIVVNANQYTTAGNAGKFTISIRATNGDSHLSIQNRLGSLCYIGLKISVNYVG
tara:strand:- start:357 stop:2147 length:1791 start_codon:yes stop_codon:yes gene_type:complete